MPSDAYMEVEPDEIWGESLDQTYGDSSPCGSFEIFTVGFETGTTDSGGDKLTGTDSQGKKITLKGQQKNAKMASSNDGEAAKPQISVEKPIDKSSPFLFRYCCEQKPFKWAVIYIREAGEESSIPWLRMEFQKLKLIKFTWEIDPGAGGDETNKSEKLLFEFETMSITYSEQDPTGRPARWPRARICGTLRTKPDRSIRSRIDRQELTAHGPA